jgi:glucose-6-phosphate 1-epimerase
MKGVVVGPGSGGLERILIERPEARAEIYTHGATVTSWQPRNREPVLFLSGSAVFRRDKAIRGGIPICFPWFGPKAGDDKAPQHGFARTSAWTIADMREDDRQQRVVVELVLASSDRSEAFWPYRFRVRYRVAIGEKLEVELEVSNTGETPFSFEEALHAYFRVADARAVHVRGLQGAEYVDKVDGGVPKRDTAEAVVLTGECDRLYQVTSAACEIVDPGLSRRISIAKDRSLSTIVWNPWIEKARGLKDFGDDEWQRMICVEAANAGRDAIALQPGAQHSMRTQIVVNAGR